MNTTSDELRSEATANWALSTPREEREEVERVLIPDYYDCPVRIGNVLPTLGWEAE